MSQSGIPGLWIIKKRPQTLTPFSYLQPPAHLLQAATTLSPIPPPSQSSSHASPEQPTTTNMSSKHFNAAQKSYIKGNHGHNFLKCVPSKMKLNFDERPHNNAKLD